MSRVSVIIVNYNGWRDTVECLDSVFRNEYPDYQVIVVDNKSSDGSMESIKAWAEGRQEALVAGESPLRHLSVLLTPKPVPYVEYTRQQAEAGGDAIHEGTPLVLVQAGENRGFAAGNNVAIRYTLARGSSRYLWLLNNDTVIDRSALTEMVRLSESEASAGMIGSKLFQYFSPEKIQTLGGTDYLGWRGFGREINTGARDHKAFDRPFLLRGYVAGASLLVKTEVVNRIGLMDEGYFMLAEESDWCLRCTRAGWSLFYCGTSRVWHKMGASSGADRARAVKDGTRKRASMGGFVIAGYYWARNQVYFMRKHFRTMLPLALVFLIPSLVRRLIGICLYDDRKKDRLALVIRGIRDGLAGRMGKIIDPDDYREPA